MSAPRLHVHGPRHPSGVVLLLHGGTENSTEPVGRWALAALRMRPFGWAVRRRARQVAVARLTFAVRGWNTEAPIADARWALARLHERFSGVPLVLVGHSMGARTALRVADDPAVLGVVALAPWTPRDEPVEALTARRIVVLHGDRDSRTGATGSRRFLDRAAAVAAETRYELVDGDGHSMLARAGYWHRRAAAYSLAILAAAPLP